MGHKFAEIAFTSPVREVQEKLGSRKGYASWDKGETINQKLGTREANFIAERDSFYLASVSETDWPYVQHRGGPAGFVRVLDSQTIGYSDFAGNRQYVSFGNVSKNDRVSLIFMDYPNRQRLKILGRIQRVDDADSETQTLLALPDYRARIERSFLITIKAFDWNCPKYITPRYSESQLQQLFSKHKEDV